MAAFDLCRLSTGCNQICKRLVCELLHSSRERWLKRRQRSACGYSLNAAKYPGSTETGTTGLGLLDWGWPKSIFCEAEVVDLGITVMSKCKPSGLCACNRQKQQLSVGWKVQPYQGSLYLCCHRTKSLTRKLRICSRSADSRLSREYWRPGKNSIQDVPE